MLWASINSFYKTFHLYPSCRIAKALFWYWKTIFDKPEIILSKII